MPTIRCGNRERGAPPTPAVRFANTETDERRRPPLLHALVLVRSASRRSANTWGSCTTSNPLSFPLSLSASLALPRSPPSPVSLVPSPSARSGGRWRCNISPVLATEDGADLRTHDGSLPSMRRCLRSAVIAERLFAVRERPCSAHLSAQPAILGPSFFVEPWSSPEAQAVWFGSLPKAADVWFRGVCAAPPGPR
jgi:hypothetical protein